MEAVAELGPQAGAHTKHIMYVLRESKLTGVEIGKERKKQDELLQVYQ